MAASDPIRVVPLHLPTPTPTPAAAPAPAAHLTYRGGPLLAAVEVVTIFWGSSWTSRRDVADALNAFFDEVLAGPLLDQLAEYRVPAYSIGHGRRTATVQVTTTDPGLTVTDAQVRDFLAAQLAAGSVPAANPNSLYFVYLPSGTTVEMSGSASCSDFCGYHDVTADGVYYAVMPAPDCAGCQGGLVELDSLTSTSSHELCEAITDPVPGQGWYDDRRGEIGDICAWQTKKLGGYTVQLEWSNRAGRCM